MRKPYARVHYGRMESIADGSCGCCWPPTKREIHRKERAALKRDTRTQFDFDVDDEEGQHYDAEVLACLGTPREWEYLWDSPWHEYDPPQGVAPLLDASGPEHYDWWREWAWCDDMPKGFSELELAAARFFIALG